MRRMVSRFTLNMANPPKDTLQGPLLSGGEWINMAEELTPDELWEKLISLSGKKFQTAGRGGHGAVTYMFCIQGGEMFVDRKDKSITRASVMMAYRNALAVQREEGYVKGPKKLGTFGASYLYPVFLHLGIIRRTPMEL